MSLRNIKIDPYGKFDTVMRQFLCKFDTVFGAIAMPSKERNHFLFKKLPSYKTYRLEGAAKNCSVSKQL